MQGDIINLKVFTPAGLALEEKVSAVALPSALGEIGMLPQHARYNGILGTGILEYTAADGGTKKLVISGGFSSFRGDTLTILADFIGLADQIDKTTYAKDRENLKKTVDAGNTLEPEFAVAQERLLRIEAIDKLLGA